MIDGTNTADSGYQRVRGNCDQRHPGKQPSRQAAIAAGPLPRLPALCDHGRVADPRCPYPYISVKQASVSGVPSFDSPDQVRSAVSTSAGTLRTGCGKSGRIEHPGSPVTACGAKVSVLHGYSLWLSVVVEGCVRRTYELL